MRDGRAVAAPWAIGHPCGVAYDDEGNRTLRTRIATGEATEYDWDIHNRLVAIRDKDAGGAVQKTVTYRYDMLGGSNSSRK